MDNKKLGGSVFWIIIILIALAGLLYLGVWSFHNNSVQGVAITAIYGIMVIAGVVLSKFEIFDSGTWGQNSFSFLLGFSLWAFWLGGSQKSVLSLTQNGLFATIASQLPISLEFVFNTYIIPIGEEVFWMIGIPFSLNWIMNIIGRKYPLVSNDFVKLIVIGITTAITFAFFHVGKLFYAFLIGAMVFRMFMVLGVIGTQYFAKSFKVLRVIALVPAFSLGSHIGNNWADPTQGPGLWGGIQLLTQNPIPGLIVLAFFIAMLISSYYYLRGIWKGKKTG